MSAQLRRLREAFGEFVQAGAFAHGRRDADQTFIRGGHVAQPAAEDFGVGRARRGFGADALFDFEFADPVI
jgi:hypothetical protein